MRLSILNCLQHYDSIWTSRTLFCFAYLCVCVRARTSGGKNNVKEGNSHGSRPPWSLEAPPNSVKRTLRTSSCQAPTGVAAGGLGWVKTSDRWGYVTSVPTRPCLVASHSSTRTRFAGGGLGAPVLS